MARIQREPAFGAGISAAQAQGLHTDLCSALLAPRQQLVKQRGAARCSLCTLGENTRQPTTTHFNRLQSRLQPAELLRRNTSQPATTLFNRANCFKGFPVIQGMGFPGVSGGFRWFPAEKAAHRRPSGCIAPRRRGFPIWMCGGFPPDEHGPFKILKSKSVHGNSGTGQIRTHGA